MPERKTTVIRVTVEIVDRFGQRVNYHHPMAGAVWETPGYPEGGLTGLELQRRIREVVERFEDDAQEAKRRP